MDSSISAEIAGASDATARRMDLGGDQLGDLALHVLGLDDVLVHAEVLRLDPQGQAEHLRAEHKEIYTDLCDLIEHGERLFYDEQHAELALWIGPQFLAFEEHLRLHEEQESELITEAYSGDIGVGD